MIEAGVGIGGKDNTGQTALHLAAMGGHVVMARLLIKAGADIGAKDNREQTALDCYLAAQKGNGTMIWLLSRDNAEFVAISNRLFTISKR